MAVSFDISSDLGKPAQIKRATLAANQWTQINVPSWSRTFTASNHDASINLYIAYTTTNGDAGALHADDDWVIVPPGGSRIFPISAGKSRGDIPASMFAGNPDAANTLDAAFEAEERVY